MLTHLIEFRVDAKVFDDVPAPHPPVPVPRGTPFPFGVDAAHPYITGNLFGFDGKIGKMVIYGRDSGLNSNAPGGQTGAWWLYGPDTAP